MSCSSGCSSKSRSRDSGNAGLLSLCEFIASYENVFSIFDSLLNVTFWDSLAIEDENRFDCTRNDFGDRHYITLHFVCSRRVSVLVVVRLGDRETCGPEECDGSELHCEEAYSCSMDILKGCFLSWALGSQLNLGAIR
jgi:hypothetical protein